MIHSMTGFASARGQAGAFGWSLDLRSVNAKGLDLRLRVPDWIEGLEAGLRERLQKRLSRGSVSLGLRVSREDGAAAPAQLNPAAMGAALDALARIEAEALERGLDLAPSRAADVLALRGVMEPAPGDDGAEVTALRAAVLEAVAGALDELLEMRRREGAALADLLEAQLAEVLTLTERAATEAEARREEMARTMQANLARVMESAAEADPDRVAQELALIAVKADVTEELDRLRAHVAAAREQLAAGGAVGRRLDFLMQEFNREANTLCSKAQSSALTATGLELKTVIDRMREQVQNVE